MKKLITLLLLITSSFAYGSIDGLDKPFPSGELIAYDLHVELDLTKYVEGFGLTGSQTENNKTYYQEFIATPTKTGTYLFENYASDLVGLEGAFNDFLRGQNGQMLMEKTVEHVRILVRMISLIPIV